MLSGIPGSCEVLEVHVGLHSGNQCSPQGPDTGNIAWNRYILETTTSLPSYSFSILLAYWGLWNNRPFTKKWAPKFYLSHSWNSCLLGSFLIACPSHTRGNHFKVSSVIKIHSSISKFWSHANHWFAHLRQGVNK